MSTASIQLLVRSDFGQAARVVDIPGAALGAGRPVTVQVEDGFQFQLKDLRTQGGKAPEVVQLLRKGSHLLISFDEWQSQPDLVLQDYFNAQLANKPRLVGENEAGQVQSFVVETSQIDGAVLALAVLPGSVSANLPESVGGAVSSGAAIGLNSFSPMLPWMGSAGLAVTGVAAAAGQAATSTREAAADKPSEGAVLQARAHTLEAPGAVRTIDLSGQGPQVLEVQLDDVLAAEPTWRVLGDADDSVLLDAAHWRAAGTTQTEGHSYQVFEAVGGVGQLWVSQTVQMV